MCWWGIESDVACWEVDFVMHSFPAVYFRRVLYAFEILGRAGRCMFVFVIGLGSSACIVWRNGCLLDGGSCAG
jgi:hypothetical protein